MMKQTMAALAAGLSILTLTGSFAAMAEQVGFRQTELTDKSGNRNLKIALWYPTSDTKPVEMIGENPAFIGIEAIKDAAPDETVYYFV
ncbi:hypothetical protein HBA92_11595 [Ochrobactrum sp. MR28]|nr:hypothetical protein [Ochrobactrum sp. MR28]MBX8818328.1 hypothetical protein [Ochrobactrum sp. MR31]